MRDSPNPGLRIAPRSRRAFFGSAIAAASGALSFRPASGHPATPATTPAPGSTQSITRNGYLPALRQHFSLEPPRTRGGHVLFGLEDDIVTLNPIVATEVFSGSVLTNVFSAIVSPSPIDGAWAPDLADSWEVSADGTVYTFHLNAGARWHDGLPVTAHDCVFTLDAVLHESGLYVARADVADVVKTYRAVNDHTFELVAQRPVATLLDKSVGGLAIVPRHIWESIPYKDWGAAPGATGTDPSKVIGSGPFKFAEWVRDDHASIVRNDDYWVPDLVPSIDRITWKVLPETSAMLQALIAGEIDACDVPVPQYESLRASHPELTFNVFDDSSFVTFTVNGDPDLQPFFADSRVRQAMLYALDRDALIDSLLDGYGTRADGIYPPPSHAYAPDRVTTIYDHDPSRARALLEEAGWVDDGNGVRHKDGVQFRTEILYGEAGELSRPIVTYLQQAWREVGLDIQPQAVAFPDMLDRRETGDFAITLHGWGGFHDDMGPLYRCDAMPPHGYNFQRICNPGFDQLNDASLFELDREQRRELLIAQGNVVNDNAHLGLLFFWKSVTAAQPRVRNYVPSAFALMWSLPWIWLDE